MDPKPTPDLMLMHNCGFTLWSSKLKYMLLRSACNDGYHLHLPIVFGIKISLELPGTSYKPGQPNKVTLTPGQ